jgi:hypothetical protein
MKICPKCKSEHIKLGIFCSRSCANSRERPIELRRRLSEIAKANPVGNVVLQKINKAVYRTLPRIKVNCKHCNNIFEIKSTQKKMYCSYECRKINSGGLRDGSGRGKSGYYNGFFCSSTYELAYLIYNIDHNIPITRNKKYWKYQYKNKTHKFYPDFYVNGNLVEIKSFRSEITDLKISSVTEPITVLYKENLKDIFDYVEAKTNLKQREFYKLYDSTKKV